MRNILGAQGGLRQTMIPGQPRNIMRAQSSSAQFVRFGPENLAMGVNLQPLSYFDPSWTFVDAWEAADATERTSGAFDHNTPFPWFVDANTNNQPLPQLTPDGYPSGLPGGVRVSNLMMYRGVDGEYPAGNWTCLFDGSGEVRLSIDASVTFNHDGVGSFSGVFNVTPSDGGVLVRIQESAPTNPVRNIRLYMPGFGPSSNRWHPKFLEWLEPFELIRFMDWMETNNSTVVDWEDRRPSDYRTEYGPLDPRDPATSGIEPGVKYETMVDLCNQTLKHPWFCVPAQASDTWVTNFATQIRDTLDPSLTIYVELSNEVWNGIFDQFDYFTDLGTTNGTNRNFEYGKRADEVFTIFETVFGGLDRIVRVISGQAANSTNLLRASESIPSGRFDAMAIAPYMRNPGTSVDNSGLLASGAPGVHQFWRDNFPVTSGWISSNKAIADASGVPLICYEGGQSSFGTTTFLKNLYTDTFLEANRRAEISGVYDDYYDLIQSQASGVFMHYSSIRNHNDNGSWGMQEYQTQTNTGIDASGAAKYGATIARANAWKALR